VFVRLNRSDVDHGAIKQQVSDNIVQQIGQIARPKAVVITEALPKTVSGKIMRRLLKEVVLKGEVAGDVTGLEDPETVEVIKHVVEQNASLK